MLNAPKGMPDMDMTKAELLAYAEDSGVPVRTSWTKARIIEEIEAAQ